MELAVSANTVTKQMVSNNHTFIMWYSTLHYLNTKPNTTLPGSTQQWSHCTLIFLEGSLAAGVQERADVDGRS